jgi:hypothetical protein
MKSILKIQYSTGSKVLPKQKHKESETIINIKDTLCNMKSEDVI